MLVVTWLSAVQKNVSRNGKACFIYAGTYDIEELPRKKEYGITGQLVHTRPLEINSISDEDCDKLIDSWDEVEFEPRAKEYIKNLSGRVPYWIQWICLDCGKYAISHNYHHLGYSEVNKVVQILTGEVSPAGDKTITWEKIDITNFQQNQYMPGENEDAECAVISCIAYLNRNNLEYARGVSIKDMKYIWDKYSLSMDDLKDYPTEYYPGFPEYRKCILSKEQVDDFINRVSSIDINKYIEKILKTGYNVKP